MTKERNHFCLGKYVPAISYKIHKMNQDPQTSTINLKGLAIGDGLTDPIHQMSYGDFLFQTGLGMYQRWSLVKFGVNSNSNSSERSLSNSNNAKMEQ